MITGPDNLFALPALVSLLRQELERVPAQAASLPGGRALLVQACSANRGLAVDLRHLLPVRLHVDGRKLAGDVSCEASAMPWEDDAFRFIVVQHATDALPSAGDFIDEVVRVLAPGGSLLWFGLNPWSPWLAWTHWQARQGLPMPRTSPAEFARRRLLKRQLAPVALDYMGTCWPQSGDAAALHRLRLFAPVRGAYQLLATKQRSVLTPLRPRPLRARGGLPQLAAVPSRRASA